MGQADWWVPRFFDSQRAIEFVSSGPREKDSAVLIEVHEALNRANDALRDFAVASQCAPDTSLRMLQLRESVAAASLAIGPLSLREYFVATMLEHRADAVRAVANFETASAYADRNWRTPGTEFDGQYALRVHARLFKGLGPGKKGFRTAEAEPLRVDERGAGLRRFPVERIASATDGLLRQTGRSLPPLVSASLFHAKWMWIRPLEDGNRRMAQLLTSAFLRYIKCPDAAVLMLARQIAAHAAEYSDRLLAWKGQGRWLEWTLFYVNMVHDAAEEATACLVAAGRLVESCRAVLLQGRTTVSTIRLFESLTNTPVVKTASVQKEQQVTKPTAQAALNQLVELGILEEYTGHERYRYYGFEPYLRIFNAAVSGA